MTGRHRRTANPLAGLRAFGTALTVITLMAGAAFGYQQLTSGEGGGGGCADPLPLAVAVTPELTSAVQATATAWVRTSPTVGSRCISVDVFGADSADMAGAIAARAGETLGGLGVGGGQRSRVPDVWIPDSSSWLQRLRAAGPDLVPATAPPTARSPIVVAMPEPVAGTFGWPATKLTWTDLIRRMTTGTGLRAGIVEPTRDAAGLAGLVSLAVAANAAGGADGQQATAAALRGLVVGRSTVRDDLLQRFPRSGDAAGIAQGISAAPLSEQAVNAYNARSPAVPLAAVYVEPVPASLDYPFTVIPGGAADRTAAAEKLRAALAGDQFRDRLAAAGLRGADGSTGEGFPAAPGAPATGGQGGAVAEPATVDRILTTWTAMTAPARTLAVIDVSGSMLRPVPTAGNATRMQVTLTAARGGLALFDDTWSLGLWLFSTRLDGARDHIQLVPIGPLSSQRQQVLGALAAVQPKVDGDTGLYDTILAGYRTLQQGWEPGMVNTLIVMTDGENDDDTGLSREQLLVELGGLKSPQKPVRVLLITIGPDVAPDSLKPITDLTGGGVFAAPDPARIGDIFLQAITTRAG